MCIIYINTYSCMIICGLYSTSGRFGLALLVVFTTSVSTISFHVCVYFSAGHITVYYYNDA